MKMQPDRIEDLIAANALYRPGPMDLIPDYSDRKHGAKWSAAPPDHGRGPRRDLRHHGLPGTGHADLQPAGRHPAARRLHADQGDQQEEGRPHREGEGAVPRRVRRQGPEEGRGRADLRADRAVRRLRLQQEPLDPLRHHRLPDGLPQGVLPRRVHGGPADLRNGRHGQDGRVHRRVPERMGIEVMAAGHQRQRRRFHAAVQGDRPGP